MRRVNPFFPSLSMFNKIPFSLICRNRFHPTLGRNCHLLAKPVSISNVNVNFFAVDKIRNLSVVATAAKSPLNTSTTKEMSNKARRKLQRESPEGLLKFKLDMCSKHGKLKEALCLYDEGSSNGVSLKLHHYNVLLYLCAREASGDGGEVNELKELGLKRGFEIFQKMISDKISPNETTFTSMARLAVAREDPDMAFELVKQMKSLGIPPKLRSYGPALFGFCEKGNAEKGYEVDAHMAESGVMPEEPEFSALLKVSVDRKKVDKVYEMLQRLRATVRQVSESTLQIIEDWFKSEDAAKVGAESWDVKKIKEAVVGGGGGWHGQGWLGNGRWRVVRTKMTKNGLCQSCGEKLVCIDIDPKETENFAIKLTELACHKEVKADFVQFQEWLKQHGPFDAVVDGANVGLIKADTFNFYQLNNVVNQLRQMSPSRRSPLVILHQSRVTGGPARITNNRNLLESWKRAGALYATPPGSNDDWYWLYAAVSCKCLLVTNDEMRDHLFQLLGTSFFPRWKEKHQVRLSMTRNGLMLHMPPPYSIVIQESESGNWHVPPITDNDILNPRQWLCASRSRTNKTS
ncbi:proteinaceous RNase P 1, chloroplastic/mitochondrial [Durio zibethinus]|uniref:ribonuclease P n=1 Tax=Durio zibethinus TaxID=66656 RepID=A0A6P5Z558_DURZI|nr:proteinaceous RNase P 1, chloroplastic/mitochondrial [Durio zibethinus]